MRFSPGAGCNLGYRGRADSLPRPVGMQKGTIERNAFMSEPWPVLVEKSFQIAWDFLERSGEITDAADASRFLLRSIDDMARAGEHRPLMLANNAIDAYRRYKRLLAA